VQEELNGTSFVIFGDCMNILQVFKVKVVDTPIVDTRLVLNWTPSSTTCSSSHWLPQSAPQQPLVTLETLCWNRIHVLSNLGSLSGVYSLISSCPKKVGVTFGCTHLSGCEKRGLGVLTLKGRKLVTQILSPVWYPSL
jgi:hypothetical protein